MRKPRKNHYWRKPLDLSKSEWDQKNGDPTYKREKSKPIPDDVLAEVNRMQKERETEDSPYRTRGPYEPTG